jgi:hypothetical protein
MLVTHKEYEEGRERREGISEERVETRERRKKRGKREERKGFNLFNSCSFAQGCHKRYPLCVLHWPMVQGGDRVEKYFEKRSVLPLPHSLLSLSLSSLLPPLPSPSLIFSQSR